MEPREVSTKSMRKRRSWEQTKEEEEPQQVPSGEDKCLDIITAHIEWKRHMEVTKSEVLAQVHAQLNKLLDKALEEAAHTFPQRLKKGPGKKQSREKEKVLEKQKVFVDQQSLLDPVLNFNLFIFAFGQLPTALTAWLCMFLYTLLVPYKALQLWATSLKTVRFPKLFTVAMAAVLLACHAAGLGFCPIYTAVSYRLGPASRFIVILEQIRFLMKSHSFLRESVPPILQSTSQDGKVHPPEFSTYLYFLFCPTLIYRENYPRTPYVRWTYVIQNFAKFLGCVFYLHLIMVHHCVPVFTNLSKQPFTVKTLVLSIFNATLPGMVLLLACFFGLLHCWQNAFAEMLRFADRTFYKDWWNSTSFSTYYRKWNVTVHDWLYCYIYQDFLWLLRGKGRAVAMLSVFIVSAAVHEYSFTLCFGFFYPVMFTLFAIFGVIFNFILNDKRTSPVWNVLMWIFLFVGQGIQVCLYCQEWYAQIDCPLKERTFWGIVTPRSWSCRT
ncbi:sterol O-acyltransferase 2 isoform X2 [Elgaria multicarinata webbii]|uniref:sterol O-acyltransferase 2 isoform X2 n=1 Tax=Elgaria multicarinata webbii TaxID=159646 RepID=UPI002FCD374D